MIDVSRQPGQVRAAVEALAPRSAHWVFVSSCSVYADPTIVGGDESMSLTEPLAGDAMADMSQYSAAKSACERLVLDGVGTDRVHVARVSLIGGPGDHTGRGVYWPWRFGHPSNPERRVLVPEVATSVQLIDVRDLAEHLRIAREAVGAEVELVPVAEDWLLEREVQPWSGPRSLPLWLPADAAGLNSSSTAVAESLGLRRRPLAETLADALTWREAHPERELKAGLSDADELELLAALR